MEIKIGKSSNKCAECERNFEHEEMFNSRAQILDDQLVRQDFCSTCWVDNRNVDAYFAWSSRYCDPAVADAQPPEIFSPLRQLFYESLDFDTALDGATAFLAAQLLRRQKAFCLIKESDEGDGELHVLLFNDRIGNRLVEVRDPNFTYGQLETARSSLLQRLAELEGTDEGDNADVDLVEEEYAAS